MAERKGLRNPALSMKELLSDPTIIAYYVGTDISSLERRMLAEGATTATSLVTQNAKSEEETTEDSE